MKKYFKQISSLGALLGLLLLPYFVFAQGTLKNLSAVGTAGGYDAGTNELTAAGIAGTAIKTFLSLLGIIFIILIILAGYNWMIANGDEQKITKAKDTLRASIIGLVIILGSYAIWMFIFAKLIISS
jgi:cytochrome bd-type quinol oxidase subunit 2